MLPGSYSEKCFTLNAIHLHHNIFIALFWIVDRLDVWNSTSAMENLQFSKHDTDKSKLVFFFLTLPFQDKAVGICGRKLDWNNIFVIEFQNFDFIQSRKIDLFIRILQNQEH